eukprot:Anaeramoba_ignava/a218844_8.p1 GENE.a218844_8~~a218844_8.p1  ORF type:complete len:105 (+),score=25.48 a218844_8:711-1025(+)
MILKDFPEILILTTKKTNSFNKNKENINGKDDLFVPRDEKEEICQKYELIAIFHRTYLADKTFHYYVEIKLRNQQWWLFNDSLFYRVYTHTNKSSSMIFFYSKL